MKNIGTMTLAAALLLVSYLTAGTTGKIAGTVTDGRSGEPLPGVNIVLVGTTYGAVSDFEGNFIIINLPPGTYTIRASAIGYSPLSYANIRVSVDLTTRQDFKLSEETVQLENEVVITAERPLVQKDLTATTAVVGGDDIKQLPITEISQVINLQAGNVAGSIRGGRRGETAYWIDGVPVTDVFNGSAVVDVNPSMVQELQVLSGAFNAEYGQAMSGIVNIVTREGADKFSGSVTAYGGDFLSNHGGTFKGIQKFEPFNIRNIEASLSGPVIERDLSFFLNARNIYYGGYLEGIRTYTPSTVITLQNDKPYIVGTDHTTDSALVWNSLVTANPSIQAASDSARTAAFNNAYGSFKNAYVNGVGDGARVKMNWNRKMYLQAKLAARFSPELKLNVTGIYDNVESVGYNRDLQYNPDGQGHDFSTSYTTIFQLTHTLSASTFYTIGGSFFEKTYKHYLYEDADDPRYTHPKLFELSKGLSQYSYSVGGSDMSRYHRVTTTGLLKFDLSSQVNNEHFVKAGVEARQHRLFVQDVTLLPVQTQTEFTLGLSSPFIATRILPDSTLSHDRYTRTPMEISAYLQDKMEFKDLIINIGVRVDYFDPNGKVLADEEDPNIFNPFKESNKYFDYNGNGVQDANEPAKTVDDRMAYWYKDASAKLQLSPRFGASFPITDRGVIHFSYGHFFQIPNFERLYANPAFKTGSGTGNVDHRGSPTGNADLKPEQTINGEIGLQQQLTDDMSIDVTVYLRDIRNLAGTRAEQIPIGGPGAAQTYSKYVNSDFGFIRGFILSLDKRFGQGMAMTVDYTFQIARGSASDPNEARNQLASGQLPEVQLTPLGWDQRHTLNATFSYSEETWGGSVVSSYGSGTPYTPRLSRDISVFLTNSQTKPTYFNTDVRVYKSFVFDPVRLMLFLRVNNLFDTMNETGVFDDTGRAGKTYDEDRARLTNSREYINTIRDYYTVPTNYSEPRRIEFGATIEF
ncbi:MAG: TonB-dependent receptor plug domain-containing protein [Bacteroidetes bacterium]|nr:MAG: TonB-dependent receptor plug domain-containing protein [Bacteroidota bacterium]